MKIKLDSEIIKNRRTASGGFKTKQLSRWQQQLLQCNNFTISSLLELGAHHSSCERHGLRGQTRIHSMIRIGFSGFFRFTGFFGFSWFWGHLTSDKPWQQLHLEFNIQIHSVRVSCCKGEVEIWIFTMDIYGLSKCSVAEHALFQVWVKVMWKKSGRSVSIKFSPTSSFSKDKYKLCTCVRQLFNLKLWDSLVDLCHLFSVRSKSSKNRKQPHLVWPISPENICLKELQRTRSSGRSARSGWNVWANSCVTRESCSLPKHEKH